LVREFGKEVDRLAKELGKSRNDNKEDDFARRLIPLGRIMVDICMLKDDARTAIEKAVDKSESEFIFRVGDFLQKWNGDDDDKRIATEILTRFPCFKDFQAALWNQKTAASQKDLPSVLRDMQVRKIDGSGNLLDARINSRALQKGVEEYQKRYEEILDEWKFLHESKAADWVESLVDGIKDKARSVAPGSIKSWGNRLREALPDLLARVGAYYTITKSNAKAKHSRQGPHSIQILAVLRLFGYDSSNPSTLARQLMEVRTGEGKSMVLGLSSLLFALLGFRVYCVCYSKHLSERDWNSFLDVFCEFQVIGLVTYGTIDDYVHDSLRGVERLTQQLICQGEVESESSTATEEILLLDEVDMFFGPNFRGETLNKVALLKSSACPQIRNIFQTVWKLRSRPASQIEEEVKKTSDYLTLRAQLQKFDFVVDNEVNKMCRDVTAFSQHIYSVKGDRIVYKAFDHTTSATRHGYLTAFAYLAEAKKGSFLDQEDALDYGLALLVGCGNYSYSKINPACILGLSGTLSALGRDEWKVMSEYNFEFFCTLPSVFSKPDFVWWEQGDEQAMFSTPNREEHFKAIVEQTNKMTEQDRAVIVVFETSILRDEFEKSDASMKVKCPCRQFLHEEDTLETKDHKIGQAATKGQATFISAMFGRGTDFVCKDPAVQKAGGVHVIQAFFSLEKSEEVQIQGRTARYGDKGSYSMILCHDDLEEQFGCFNEVSDEERSKFNSIQTPRQAYDFFDTKRQQKQHLNHLDMEKKVVVAEERHETSMRYKEALFRGDGRYCKDVYDM